MKSREERLDVDATPEVPDLDGVTGYDDGDGHVICDRENPNAWVRSDETTEIEV